MRAHSSFRASTPARSSSIPPLHRDRTQQKSALDWRFFNFPPLPESSAIHAGEVGGIAVSVVSRGRRSKGSACDRTATPGRACAGGYRRGYPIHPIRFHLWRSDRSRSCGRAGSDYFAALTEDGVDAIVGASSDLDAGSRNQYRRHPPPRRSFQLAVELPERCRCA